MQFSHVENQEGNHWDGFPAQETGKWMGKQVSYVGTSPGPSSFLLSIPAFLVYHMGFVSFHLFSLLPHYLLERFGQDVKKVERRSLPT